MHVGLLCIPEPANFNEWVCACCDNYSDIYRKGATSGDCRELARLSSGLGDKLNSRLKFAQAATVCKFL